MNIHKNKLILGMTVLAVTVMACGTNQVGVVTPMPDGDEQPIKASQEIVQKVTPAEGTDGPADDDPMSTPGEKILEPPPTMAVTAWFGQIVSLPEGSPYDDFVTLSPEGTGEFGLTGATLEIEAEIRSLWDAEGPNSYVHLWGTLSCEVEDYNGCQLLVEKLQYGANFSEEDIHGWVGTITNSTFNNGISYVFELSGDFPMWYSIHASQDDALQGQIESFRDTGAMVQVGGKLMVGVPDVNGTRIEVASLEVLKAGTLEPPPLEEAFDPTADWPVFVNDRYGYQIKYPKDATISLFGPVGFSMEDIPEGMTPDQYMESLLEEYTDRLCVKVEYALGWIYIAAPPNMERFLNPCGPTGLGAGEIINQVETIRIGDQLYQANGTEFKLQVTDAAGNPVTGETLDLHGEMFRVELEDDTVIRFGSQPRQNATYDDYLMKTKEMLLRILATYESIPP